MELPKSLGSNRHRNYSPQPNLLDGYNMMPRMAAVPYANSKLITNKDFNRRKRSVDTSRFFKNVAKNINSTKNGNRNEVLLDGWNNKYASRLSVDLKNHNIGTSFLVAPINLTNNEKVKSNFKEVQDYLYDKNEMYIKAHQIDEEEGAKGGALGKFKKSPS